MRPNSIAVATIALAALTAGLLFVGGAGAAGCRNGERAPSASPAVAPSSGVPAAPKTDGTAAAKQEKRMPVVTLHPSGGPRVDIAVELAIRPQERARGLMYRESLGADRGMLFVFAQEGEWPFYMKNTYIPLDLIYIDDAGRVVGVIEDMQPLDETARSVGRPARYVLEVNAGSVRRWGLQAGDRTDLPTP